MNRTGNAESFLHELERAAAVYQSAKTELESFAYLHGHAPDGMPRGRGSRCSPVERSAQALAALRGRCEEAGDYLGSLAVSWDRAARVLEPGERKLLEFKYVGGMTWDAAAKRVGVARSTAYVWRDRAVAKLERTGL